MVRYDLGEIIEDLSERGWNAEELLNKTTTRQNVKSLVEGLVNLDDGSLLKVVENTPFLDNSSSGNLLIGLRSEGSKQFYGVARTFFLTYYQTKDGRVPNEIADTLTEFEYSNFGKLSVLSDIIRGQIPHYELSKIKKALVFLRDETVTKVAVKYEQFKSLPLILAELMRLSLSSTNSEEVSDHASVLLDENVFKAIKTYDEKGKNVLVYYFLH